MDSISLHEVQSSSSSSELAAPVALQTPTHTFNLNLTRDQYADLIESLQCLNQQDQNQQPSLVAHIDSISFMNSSVTGALLSVYSFNPFEG